MRTRRGAILICGPGPWRLGAWTGAELAWIDTGISPQADEAEIIEKLPAAIDQIAGRRDRPFVLALPSGSFLAASIATGGLPRTDRRRAMEYRLEGKLPMAIEEVTSEFISHNGRALGVCVLTKKIDSILQGVRRCGVQIAAVCPAAILGFQSGLHRSDQRDGVDAVIWRTGESADIFLLDKGQLVQWYAVPATAADVGIILASCSIARGAPMRVTLRGAEPEWSAEIGALPHAQIISNDPLALNDAARQAAMGILAEGAEPLVNVNTQASGAISRRPLIAALAACLLLCFSLIGGAVWRANRYANITAGLGDQEHVLFQQLFPDEPVPLGVESRLKSYAPRLEQPASTGSSASQIQTSSLTLLFNVLSNLPPGAHFQFDDLQFDSGRATLHGRAGSLAQADEIAAALRKSRDLLVDDPQTQQLADGGVEFTISARSGAGGIP
jgi:hypothetical protein